MDCEIPVVQGDNIYLAAKSRKGISELVDLISTHVFKDYTKCVMLIPYEQGQVVSYMNEHAHVIATEYEHEGTRLTLECKTMDVEKYREYVI
ncbi:GTPase HflX [compost metagenome]